MGAVQLVCRTLHPISDENLPGRICYLGMCGWEAVVSLILQIDIMATNISNCSLEVYHVILCILIKAQLKLKCN